MIEQWSSEWPKEEGRFWFYGLRFRGEKPTLLFVRVWRTHDSWAYVIEGSFAYKEEGTLGLWLKIETPDIPTKHFERLIK